MLALIVCAAFTSCADELNIEQKGVIPTENFYKTDADCEKALASAYEFFTIQTFGRTTFGAYIYTPNKVMGNDPGDDVLYAGGNYGDHEFGGSINEFRYNHTPEAINFMYKGLYSSVYYCNLVIDYFAESADKPDFKQTAFMKQAIAEARVLRAYDYFLLANYWGQPPFVDHLLPSDALPENNQVTQLEYYNWVAKECEEAYANLTSRNGQTDKAGCVRVTKGFADALAGKAYLFAGEYDKAKAALKKVIDSNNYDLVPGSEWANIFHAEGDCSKEKVFELNMEYNSAVGDWGFGSGNGAYQHSSWMEANCFCWREGNLAISPIQVYNGFIGGWGSIGIPEWYGDAFQANDGDSYRRKGTIIRVDDALYLRDEAREYGMTYTNPALVAMTPEQLDTCHSIGINNLEQGLYDNSFWLPVKHLARGTDMSDGGGSHGSNLRLNNFIVMRYAEVLLMYAEACVQAKTPDLTAALWALNKIQNRAGSNHVSTVANLEEVKNEKLFEMWFEGCRFQDVLRWNDTAAKARLAKAGHKNPHLFDKLYRKVKAGETPNWQYGSEANSRFYILYTHEAMDAGYQCGFVEGKHNLFPYPSDAIAQNTNLHQNPGWE